MDREKSRGRTATVARPKPKPKNERREEVDKDKSWRVLLHNDDVRCAHFLSPSSEKLPVYRARPLPTV